MLTLDRGECVFEKGEPLKGLFVVVGGTVAEVYDQHQVPLKTVELHIDSWPTKVEADCASLVD